MCGIAGIAGSPGAEGDVRRAIARLRHRGPDGDGIAIAGDAIHGHVRLAIMDPAHGQQPWRHRDILLSYVGELWNAPELRTELLGCGYTFETSCDTEVLAIALHHWGIDALERIDGMYAFAASIGDDTWLARDRYGKIPLYVAADGGMTYWASERKAFPERSASFTALAAGRAVCIRGAVTGADRRLGLGLEYRPNAFGWETIVRAVRKRLVADVPLACLVSGGIDSTLILAAAVAAKPDIVAYTAVLDPHSADLRWARRACAALSVRLVEVPIDPPTRRTLETAARCIEISSKAQIEIAALCLPLARAIRSDGVKVILSGEGADELFGGYGNAIIRGRGTDDAGWRLIIRLQLARMARGNFVRINKAFMSAGVEARMPFIDRAIVSWALGASRAENPPGKGALKAIATGRIPDGIVARPKATFQGESGMSEAAELAVGGPPMRWYNAIIRDIYGARLTE